MAAIGTPKPKWDEVEDFCNAEIERLHLALERSRTHEESQALRGEIRAVRRVLALRAEPPDPDKMIGSPTPEQ